MDNIIANKFSLKSAKMTFDIGIEMIKQMLTSFFESRFYNDFFQYFVFCVSLLFTAWIYARGIKGFSNRMKDSTKKRNDGLTDTEPDLWFPQLQLPPAHIEEFSSSITRNDSYAHPDLTSSTIVNNMKESNPLDSIPFYLLYKDESISPKLNNELYNKLHNIDPTLGETIDTLHDFRNLGYYDLNESQNTVLMKLLFDNTRRSLSHQSGLKSTKIIYRAGEIRGKEEKRQKQDEKKIKTRIGILRLGNRVRFLNVGTVDKF